MKKDVDGIEAGDYGSRMSNSNRNPLHFSENTTARDQAAWEREYDSAKREYDARKEEMSDDEKGI